MKTYYRSRKVYRSEHLLVDEKHPILLDDVFGFCPVWSNKKKALKVLPKEFIEEITVEKGEKK